MVKDVLATGGAIAAIVTGIIVTWIVGDALGTGDICILGGNSIDGAFV